MTPDQIFLIRSTFHRLEAMPEKAAELFYDQLWAIDASTAPLFAQSDMALQGHKLMASMAYVVNALDKPDAVLPVAQDLARRHIAYGVTQSHYVSMGKALLGMLEQFLGADFTPEVAAAWDEAYALLSGIMTTAAYPG